MYSENIKEWFDYIQSRICQFKEREDKIKMKVRRIYTDIDFSNLALTVFKKSASKVDVKMNSALMSDANKILVTNYNQKIIFEFRDNKFNFVFNLEDCFLDFFLNSDYVYEKYIILH
jgi:hypothetical protein